MSRTSFDFIRRFILRRAAIVLDESKEYLVQARLIPMAKRHGYQTIDQLVPELHKCPDGPLGDEVVDAMTTNETSFFRDGAPFEALRAAILPELFRRRAEMRRLTIWSAACSTGQEPYSIAMLLREHFTSYLDWNIRIIASDLSHTALRQAIEGHYGELEITRGLPGHLCAKYFQRDETSWIANNEIRRMVEFRSLNLIEQWPLLPKMDVIMLRNVMVYFESATKTRLLRHIRRQLWPDGYLFLGGAETTMQLDDSFGRVTHNGASYFQLRENGT